MSPPEREAWLRGCDVEHDNFRAAIHLIATGEAEWALRLAAALFRFWEQRDHLTEGRETLARVLAMPEAPSADAPARARAVRRRVLTDIQGDSMRPRRSATRPARIYRQFGDTHGVAATMTAMAWQAQRQGRYRGSHVALRRNGGAVAAARRLHRGGPRASNMANAAKAEGNFELAAACSNRSPRPRRREATSAALRRRSTGSATSRRRRAIRDSARRYHHQSLDRYQRDQRSVGHGAGAGGPGQRRSAGRATTRRPTVAQGGAPGVSRARPSARRRPSARVVVVVRQLPVARRRGGGAGERRRGDPALQIGHRPSRSSGRRSSARWRWRGRASAQRPTRTPGSEGARRRSIGSLGWRLAARRDRRTQAYRRGSMSRRTAEIRFAGTPSLRACSRMTASSGAR